MQKISFLKDLHFSDKPQITLMYESSVSKEIRICMAKGNIMQEHKAPGAISIMLLKGKLLLGSQGDEISMEEGEMVSFEPQVPHSLEAIDECVIRLVLSKHDTVQRVQGVIGSGVGL